MPVGKIAGKIGSILSGGFIEGVKDVVDDLTFSKEERAQHEADMERSRQESEYRNRELDFNEEKLAVERELGIVEKVVEDRKSAREFETNVIQSNPSKVWGVTVNRATIIAFMVVLSTILLCIFVLFSDSKLTESKENLIFLIMGALLNELKGITSYHFSSTLDSGKKNDAISTLTKRIENIDKR